MSDDLYPYVSIFVLELTTGPYNDPLLRKLGECYVVANEMVFFRLFSERLKTRKACFS